MPETHGDSPVGHGAVGVVLGDVEEFLFGLFVPEGVEQGDSAGEGLLDRRRAGDWEVDGAELSLGELLVVMMIFVVVFVVVGEAKEVTRNEKSSKQARRFMVHPTSGEGILVARAPTVKRREGGVVIPRIFFRVRVNPWIDGS